MAEIHKPTFFQTPGLGIVAGAVVGVAIVVAMTASGFFQHEETATQIPTPQAAIDFASHYEDMLEGDFVQKRKAERVSISGQSSVSESVVAQYDGDSVVIAGGNITAIRNDERSVCPIPVDGASANCPAPRSYDSEKATEDQIKQVKQLVNEEDGAYDVSTADNRCYQLTLSTSGLQSDRTSLPWGNRAEFCFDDATGALRSARIERDAGADAITTAFLSGTVDGSVLDRLAQGNQSDVS